MKAGPKQAVDKSPLPFTCDATGVERFAAWCEQFLTVPKGRGAGGPMRLRDWQLEMLRPFLDPDPRPVVGAIMGPRGLGKTGIFASLGLYELFEGPDGNEIPIVAVDERMALRMLKPAIQMVELNPELSSRALLYRDRIELPGKRSTLTALPAEAKRIEGLGTWTLALADELGEIDPDTWTTLLLGAGKLDGMALGIGTPPNRESSVLTDLREAVRANPDDKTMAFVEFSADGFEHHPVNCVHCLELANPQLDDLLSRDRATALLKQTTEGEYRRKRLCQVVCTNESPFLTAEGWDELNTGVGVPNGAEVVLAVDASLKDDTTGIVVGQIGPKPHFDTLAVWAKPPNDDGWRVPMAQVEQVIREATKRWRVREVAYDPAYFTRSAQVLAAEGVPMVEFIQSPTRQTMATNDLRTAALNKSFTHSGDEDLRRHVLGATVLETDKGIRIAKTSRSRNAAKVDLCTALMMCHSRATWLATRPKKKARAYSF